MTRKIGQLLPVILILVCIAVMGFVQVTQSYAEPPKTRVQIFEGGPDGRIKVVFSNPIEVYFETSPGSDVWEQKYPRSNPGVLCVCVGADCDDNLEQNKINMGNPDYDISLDCHEIKDSGPISTGCPFIGTRGYLYGGDLYR